MTERNQPFRNRFCPHHQGSDMTGYLEYTLYTPAQNQYSWLGTIKLLLCLASLFHWCLTDCLSMLVTGYHAWLGVKPPFLLKLLKHRWISTVFHSAVHMKLKLTWNWHRNILTQMAKELHLHWTTQIILTHLTSKHVVAFVFNQ